VRVITLGCMNTPSLDNIIEGLNGPSSPAAPPLPGTAEYSNGNPKGHNVRLTREFSRGYSKGRSSRGHSGDHSAVRWGPAPAVLPQANGTEASMGS